MIVETNTCHRHGKVRRSTVKPLLIGIAVLAAIASLCSWRATSLHAKDTTSIYTTSEEAAKAFMTALMDSGAVVGDTDNSRTILTNVISRESISTLQADGAEEMLEMMRAMFMMPTWKAQRQHSASENNATVKVTLNMFAPQDVICVKVNGAWKVDLIATYAAWKEMSALEVESTFLKARDNARRASCQSNMKQIALGLKQYIQDYDELYPPAKEWQTVIYPYVKSEQIFNCPSVGRGNKYGYAMNWKLSRSNESSINHSATMVMLYESKVLKPNHSGEGKDIAYRHVGNTTNIGFVDGHVKWFAKNDAGKWPNVHFTFKPQN